MFFRNFTRTRACITAVKNKLYVDSEGRYYIRYNISAHFLH